ncbi:hypothetical protein HUG10_14580 [Halorarum halophilum]|uniref:Uncharacterized protein n=1 Tax=Halorarum halophilum TaxID=2743090 RepID=A0A7D5GJ77_9EURY|nr:hypothetical protein [Halobaculum halophilum]QLG28691.1 hypothetical protein HUG10_14580 [Halobaculum halophilum]
MTLTATEEDGASATTQWLHGFWAYYREYTHTAMHAASAAALTAFGLLVFIDRLFVLLAIATYLFPPLILYHRDTPLGTTSDPSPGATLQAESESNSDDDSDTDSDSDDGDSDSDSDDGDTDSDGPNSDADADGADADADANG